MDDNMSTLQQDIISFKNLLEQNLQSINIFTDDADGLKTLAEKITEEYVFVDKGISANSNLSNFTTKSANLTATATAEYTELTQTGTANTYLGVDIPKNCIIRFDIYQSGGTVNNYFFRIDNGSWGGYWGGNGLNWIDGALNEWVSVEIAFLNGIMYVKNTDTGTISTRMNSTLPTEIVNPCFRFWMIDGKTLRYRNLRIIESDNIMFDAGTNGGSTTTNLKSQQWYVREEDASELTVTTDSTGTTLTSSSTTTSRYYFANPENSTSTTPPISCDDFVIDIDILLSSFANGQIAILCQGITNFNQSVYTPPYHVRIVKVGNTAKHYINNELIRTVDVTDRATRYMGFQLYKTCSIKYKNYRIRKISSNYADANIVPTNSIAQNIIELRKLMVEKILDIGKKANATNGLTTLANRICYDVVFHPFEITMNNNNTRFVVELPIQLTSTNNDVANKIVYYNNTQLTTDEQGMIYQTQTKNPYSDDKAWGNIVFDSEYITKTEDNLIIPVTETSLTAPNKTFKASAKTKTVTATLQTADGNKLAQAEVRFLLNGQTYTATTNSKGVATADVSDVSWNTGSYGLTVNFYATDMLGASNASATFKIT